MWFWYAFVSAFVSALSVILNKKALYKINASLVSWALFAFSIPFLIYPGLKDGIPQLNIKFWIGAIGSAVVFAFAKTLALKSLKGSLMSEIIPLAFFAVLIQYVFGLIFYGEILSMVSLIGLLLIISGGYILKVEEAKGDIFKPFRLLLTNKEAAMYMIAMVLMVFSTVLDKLSLINMQPVNQSFLLLAGNVVTVVIISLYMTRKNQLWLGDLKKNFGLLSISGLVYTILALFYLYGITTGPLALVSGVKKIEVFFVLILGWILFKDKPKVGVWLGSIIMLAGVILIKIG